MYYIYIIKVVWVCRRGVLARAVCSKTKRCGICRPPCVGAVLGSAFLLARRVAFCLCVRNFFTEHGAPTDRSVAGKQCEAIRNTDTPDTGEPRTRHTMDN